jgi:hypothetical protein
MRLAAIEKMGYYPTPSPVTDLVARWLIPPVNGKWRLLDPCCGMGEATARLVQAVGGTCETWGVELSPMRSEAAARVMDRVFNTAWQQVGVQEKSVSVLWLNPPYDDDNESQRLEIEFLRSAFPALVQGGVLIYIVPQRLLGYQAVARILVGHFDNLVIRRFPEEEYEQFHQIVVLGTRKPYQTPANERVEAIRALVEQELPCLGDPEAPWPVSIPPAPLTARFERTDVSDRERIARAYALGWPQEFALKPREEKRAFCPAIPLKRGHVAMLMSAGLLGMLRLHEPDGRLLLVKGRVTKFVDESVEEDDKGNKVLIQRERFATTVGIVGPNRVEVISDVESLTRFMEQYGDQVAAEILKNPPLYNLDPTPEEWQIVSGLGKNRKPLPGQKEPGLLDTQKHVAIGLARTCRRHGTALIQGEMGVGKTTIALATLELMGAYPALVLCPPHLVEKWKREAQEVIPGVHVRELRRIGKNGEKGEENDVRRFVQDWNNGLLGKKAIAVVASTSAKLGSGWGGAMAIRYTLPQSNDRQPFREAVRRYKEAREALLELRRRGADRSLLEAQQQVVEACRREALDAAIPYPVCPECGHPQTDEKDASIIMDFREFDRKPYKCSNQHPDGHPCNAPLFSFGKGQFRRWPIADYIVDKATGFFQMLICDEVHEMKAKDSDRGLAFHRLANVTRYKLALTGTFYGGKATSIFWLMHRLRMGNTHRDFAYNDERRWVQRYGVLETHIVNSRYHDGDDDNSDDFGVFNATRRRRVFVQERPGVSPAILERIIETAIFLDLSDLGEALPAYQEELVTIDMSSAGQRSQYQNMEGTLRAMAREDQRLLSLWLQWSLSRPNSGFRDEVVVKEFRNEDGEVVSKKTLLALPAVVNGSGLPKEEWLVNFVRAERNAGRKVLIYVRQTGTRDIQPRLVALLRDAGLRAEVLYSSVDSRKREQWLNNRVWNMDALVVNPELVKTGLDLIQFATVVFYEIQYSLYTLWQSMRRVWRLGQTQPVRVVFTAYRDTLEEKAIALMGQKMRAAQLLYGQEVGGAIVPDDDGDFLQELARVVLEERNLPDLRTLFAVARQETLSPMGCPTASSPRISSYTEENLRQMLEAERAARKRRKPAVDPRQLTLFAL